mgnify:CR=1 FL=1
MDKNYKLAELIGILLGDGCILIKENKHYEIKISLDKIKDKDYIPFIKKLIFDLFSIEAKEYYRNYDGCVDIRISGKDFVKYLIDNVGLKSSPKFNRAEIPQQFLIKEYYPALLRGYFDTDGCVAIVNNNGIKYPRIEMKICNSPMQAQYIKILKELNFKFGAYNIGNNAIRIQINGKKELIKWINLVGSSNPRNIERLNKFL